MEWQLHSESELTTVARHLVTELSPGGITLGLSGPLGAGKTALVRAILRAFGSSDAVSSPTYVLEHRYQTPLGLTVSHWDLYRLAAQPDELCEVCPRNEVRLIEWPERCVGVECDLVLRIEITGETGRRVVLSRVAAPQ